MSNEPKVRERAIWLAKVIYGILCVSILVKTYYRSNPYNELVDLGWTEPMWGMVLLSFPCGYVAVMIARVAIYLATIVMDHICPTCGPSPAYVWGIVAFQWAALFVGGYLQWFWLMPRIIRKLG